jgi:hypothetical protein
MAIGEGAVEKLTKETVPALKAALFSVLNETRYDTVRDINQLIDRLDGIELTIKVTLKLPEKKT